MRLFCHLIDPSFHSDLIRNVSNCHYSFSSSCSVALAIHSICTRVYAGCVTTRKNQLFALGFMHRNISVGVSTRLLAACNLGWLLFALGKSNISVAVRDSEFIPRLLEISGCWSIFCVLRPSPPQQRGMGRSSRPALSNGRQAEEWEPPIGCPYDRSGSD